jgi:signal transduction histidine kinase
MGRMIAQVLDFTRSRVGGGIPITRSPGDVAKIAAHVIEDFATPFPTRPIKTTVYGSCDGQWDHDRLEQVFGNVIGNALEYSDGSAPIEVTLDGRGDAVACVVASKGPRVPAELLPALFDPFRRGNAAKVSGTKGLGLGLFITSQIVAAHGGTISAESSADGVTSFSFDLRRR